MAGIVLSPSPSPKASANEDDDAGDDEDDASTFDDEEDGASTFSDDEMPTSKWIALCHLWQKGGSSFGIESSLVLRGRSV